MEKVRKMITRSQYEKEKIENKTKKIAKQLLKDIGMKLHCLGFKYWLKAIVMTLDIEIHKRQELKTMELYFMVAREYKTTVNCVRKAMSYTYENTNVNSFFNVTYKIDNAALLFLLKEKVKEEIETIL
jgi:sporulation initiation factor Spo0A C-terminal domain protein